MITRNRRHTSWWIRRRGPVLPTRIRGQGAVRKTSALLAPKKGNYPHRTLESHRISGGLLLLQQLQGMNKKTYLHTHKARKRIRQNTSMPSPNLRLSKQRTTLESARPTSRVIPMREQILAHRMKGRLIPLPTHQTPNP